MQIDQTRQFKTLVRYRVMFRLSLVFVALAVLILGLSVAAALAGPMPVSLPMSLLLIDLGAITAYRILNSTARLLATDAMQDNSCGWDGRAT